MTEHDESVFIPVRCLSHEEFFSVMKPFEDPEPAPSVPGIRSKAQLKTSREKSAFITAHGGKAYLSLPRE